MRVIGLSRHWLHPYFKPSLNDLKEFNNSIKQAHIDNYHRMIYDFGHWHNKFHGTCPLCSMRNVENADYHIIAKCTRIMHIRNNYFRRVYNDLAQIYTKPNKVHDLKFAQEVVKWLRGISTGFVDQWWQVASHKIFYSTKTFYTFTLTY